MGSRAGVKSRSSDESETSSFSPVNVDLLRSHKPELPQGQPGWSPSSKKFLRNPTSLTSSRNKVRAGRSAPSLHLPQPSCPDLPSLVCLSPLECFWVATAPLDPDGHVNVSPKGTLGTFHVESPAVAWCQSAPQLALGPSAADNLLPATDEDLTGSGAETFAHLQENGRITILFNAFEGPPRIVRLFGRGSVFLRGSKEYEAFIPPGEERPGSRAVIKINIYKVGSSCGFSIPYYEYLRERETLNKWAARKEDHTDFTEPSIEDKEDLRAYWIDRTSVSLDGLPTVGQHWDPSPPPPAKSFCAKPSSSPPWPPSSTLRSVATHGAAAALAAGLVHAHHEGLLDLKLIAGLAGATLAWVAGQAVGAPVPAPCCAMGL